MTQLTEKSVPAAALSKYVPKGHSPKIYIEMTKHLMGVDQRGNPRPFEDLMIFLMTSKRTGLDPMAKQIYPIYRWDSKLGAEKLTIQVGIDGMRATAQKTGEYAGSDDAVFFEKEEGKPLKATITVYKINSVTGERMPITASARWSEYVQTDKKGEPMGMWRKMPYNQLAKCAEALALRKAFPNDLSGVYSEDEMQQANKLELPVPTKKVEITDNEGMTHDVEVPVSTASQPVPQGKDGEWKQQDPITGEVVVTVPNGSMNTEVEVLDGNSPEGRDMISERLYPQKKSISEIRAQLQTMGKAAAEGEVVEEGR